MRSVPDRQSKTGSRRQRIFSPDDARHIASVRLPRIIFDFIAGSAGSETAPDRNRAAFQRLNLQPRVLRNVSQRSTGRAFLGEVFDVPFGIAPMGMCGLAHPQADRLLAEAAVRRNMPVCLSSAASMSIEEMARHAGQRAWFQLYAGPSETQTSDLVARAAAAGYQTLVLTVDVPQVSRRVRDLRNGFDMPFRIGARQFLDFALHPRWSIARLIAGAPRPANFAGKNGAGFDRSGSRAGADWDYLDRLRAAWKGRLIVKGVMSTEDARRIRDAGADAIWVSNHGGRQLDSAPAAIDILPAIRAALGSDTPIAFDSGVRGGEDILKALALGADFVMLGRPLLFALGAGGGQGLNDLLDEITLQLSTAMAQIGVCTLNEVSHRNLVNPPPDLAAMINPTEDPMHIVDGKKGTARDR